MKTLRGSWPMLVLLTCGALAAQDVEKQALKRKQLDQQRARNMARELVTGILDVQLRQLEENRLTGLEVYGDIKTMRANISELVDAEMARVVELLIAAQEQPAADRNADFVTARQMIREIVLRLSAERQNLMRRLRLAEIAEQVQRLVGLESETLAATRELPSLPRNQQAAQALETTEDQRDVKQLFLVLVETLADVRNWSGAVGTGAADGLRILKAAEVGRHLDEAVAKLAATAYPRAAEHQQAVIRGLLRMLKIVERAQGLLDAEQQAALEAVRELARRQQEIRDQTSRQPADARNDELVADQAQLQRDLDQLSKYLHEHEAAETHLAQAQQAAFDATAELFEGRREQARHEQGQVLGHLAAIEELLQRSAGMIEEDRSAAELAALAARLEETRGELSEVRQRQEQAVQQAAKDPQAAATKEEAVAEALERFESPDEMPARVSARLIEAAEAASEAAAILADADEPAQRPPELGRASDAIDRALAEVDATLNETKRKAAAVKIGELARAAEVLERAAAEERQIANEAAQASAESVDSAQAEDLVGRQAEVERIAEKVGEGVAETAPAAAEKTRAAKGAAAAAGRQLQQAAQSSGDELRQAAGRAQRQAEKAAGHLADAAAALREEIESTADAFADASGARLAQLAEARDGVESQLSKRPESIGEALARLEQAQQRIAQAAADQQRAAGRPDAAEAAELANQVQQAQRQQRQADRAAAELARGSAATSLPATATQQRVADSIEELAKRAGRRPQARAMKQAAQSDPLDEALEAARRAAAEAARRMLDDETAAAEAARQDVRENLVQAAKLAQSEAVEAAESQPAAAADPGAQARVGEATAAAQQLAGADPPAAAQKLAEAAATSARAEQALAEHSDAAVPQRQTSDALQDADAEIAETIQHLARKQAEVLAEQSGQAIELAKRTAPIEPNAAEAVRAAARSAQPAASPIQPPAPAEVASAEQAFEQNLERAAATLTARQQQVQRDQAIAEAVAALARRQQAAADEIAEQRVAAGQPVPDADRPDTPAATASRQQAASALDQATRDFAAAQEATGHGAVEISGQEQVANVPIREALELASGLPLIELPQQQPADAALPADAPGEPLANAGESAKAEPQSASSGEGASAEQPGAPGSGAEPGQRQADATHTPDGPPQPSGDLGTGFVPNSPQVTAQQMAGPQALARMQAALAQAAANREAPASAAEQLAAAAAGGGGGAKDGEEFENAPPRDGQLEQGPPQSQSGDSSRAGSDPAATIESRRFREEAWFAKLPPALRQSIRANSTRRAPRAYEERLRRYFESLD